MKLYNTSDVALVKNCQEQFNFTLPVQRCTRASPHEIHAQTLLRSRGSGCYTSIPLLPW